MKENHTYKTPEGELHKILMYDDVNKMVYINLIGTSHRWVHDDEYKTWKEYDLYRDFIPDIPAQMSEEQINISQQKIEEDAIQEFSPSSLLQHAQETTGETGSERGGMEQGIQGEEHTQESEDTGKEEIVKKKRTYKKKA